MEEYVAETVEHAGLTIKIVADPDPESPRDWSNIGVMVCFHRRHILGDKHNFDPDRYDDYEELLADIKREHGSTMVLPLYLMDHSGLSMSTGEFSCPWDSGQVGWIVDSAEGRKECGVPIDPFGREDEEAIKRLLEGEVEVYSQYLEGDVWGYVVEDEDEHSLDSCWGFYGTKEAIEAGKEAAEHEAERLRKELDEEMAELAAASITYAWNGPGVVTCGA